MPKADRALPSFSVIMCVHRMNPWLSEAIESILIQDDHDFDFLIAANACSDDLWEYLQQYSLFDKRIRLFRSEIGQLSYNLNMLIDRTSSEYIVRMDSDDISEPSRIRTLRKIISESRPDIIGSSVLVIDDRGSCIGSMDFPLSEKEIVRALPRRTVFCHPAVAIRRQFIIEARGYLGGFSSEDTDLWLRAKRMRARMQNLPEKLLQYRVHETQSIGSRAGYAEVAGLWFREFFLFPSLFSAQGLFISIVKAIFSNWLPGIRHYKKGLKSDET